MNIRRVCRTDTITVNGVSKACFIRPKNICERIRLWHMGFVNHTNGSMIKYYKG